MFNFKKCKEKRIFVNLDVYREDKFHLFPEYEIKDIDVKIYTAPSDILSSIFSSENKIYYSVLFCYPNEELSKSYNVDGIKLFLGKYSARLNKIEISKKLKMNSEQISDLLIENLENIKDKNCKICNMHNATEIIKNNHEKLFSYFN